MVCLRDLDLIAIVSPDSAKPVWSWGDGELERPHHPTLLENGNILVFDSGTTRGFSWVKELDPITKTVEWEYKADPPEEFFSNKRGVSQRLSNGNTLITESNPGRVFEVTLSGEKVWEHYSLGTTETFRR